MKPDWKDAPEWANYLALTYSGRQWTWFEFAPVYSPSCGGWIARGGRTAVAAESNVWNSCERRP